MVLRSLIKVAMAAGEAVTKAFSKAVREEMKASQHAASRQAASSSKSSPNEEREATKANARMGISLQESMQILDVKAPLNPEEIEKRFNHLFEANDKAKGGSLYIQSKVFRAKERIDAELARAAEAEQKKQEKENL
uniref:Mitochondrial import inner membrane translocase subunit TIM16 n=1 Tax=Panagrolaimus sp. PS1159 TaxID=55785 RepID=A0AC35GIV8_9BILA